MKKTLLALTGLTLALTACQSGPSGKAPVTTSMFNQFRTVNMDNKTFHLSEAKSYPLIDSWTYTLPSENKTNWTRRIEVQRFKKVNAAEIFQQMQGATANQSQTAHAASHTICFITEREDGLIKEANVWRYADSPSSQTYGTGIIWRYRTGEDFNRFKQATFPRTCTAMRTQPVLMPAAISKP